MKVIICGWYGTETIGDRAILAGIIKILDKAFGEVEVMIGSLYPFLTKRTLIEDMSIYTNIGPKITINYFDVNKINTLDMTIDISDIVIFGGGPIMDLVELEIMRYIFVKAKKMNKRTIILGCGIGPLYKKQYRKTAADILKHSDLVIFRDSNSIRSATEICKTEEGRFLYSYDPAILAVGEYLANNNIKKGEGNSIAINLREFHNIGFRSKEYLDEKKLIKLLDIISRYFDKVKLVPMHTFGIGGDDRLYLTKISDTLERNNIEVIHKPQNLFQTFKLFADSTACIGMRYHSVVLQILLNGNNYILDYTDINKGKISSFLNLIDINGFYKDRYLNMQKDVEFEMMRNIPNKLIYNETFEYDNNIFNDTLNYYCENISEIL